jgi:cobalt-zinc-cadmium efflux system membrane fusion protein
LPSIVLFSCKETATEEVVIRDDTMVTVTSPQFKSSTMEIASPTEQDFEVTIKAAGKLMFRQKIEQSDYFRWLKRR